MGVNYECILTPRPEMPLFTELMRVIPVMEFLAYMQMPGIPDMLVLALTLMVVFILEETITVLLSIQTV